VLATRLANATRSTPPLLSCPRGGVDLVGPLL
jgi:hypothetical protein